MTLSDDATERAAIQLAWWFLAFQKHSALAKQFRARTENAPRLRKMIATLARKLLIALWHFVRKGVVPEGVVPHPWGTPLTKNTL